MGLQKRKIGEINRKAIVTGNPTFTTKNEIHVEDLCNNSGGNSEGGGNTGGGTELEGEYFLAKPNGRYWKSKISEIYSVRYGAYPVINLGKLSSENEEAVLYSQEFMQNFACSGIGDIDAGVPGSGSSVLRSPRDVSYKAGEIKFKYLAGENPRISDFTAAWCESNIQIDGYSLSVIEFIRWQSEDFESMTDDEVLAMISEMCLIEQVTKEEYESWYKW